MAEIISPIIEYTSTGKTSDLICPRCGSHNLHHSGVTVFDRNEDSDSLVRMMIEGSKIVTEVVPSNNSGNPSSRRDGIAINFWCEGCLNDVDDGKIELIIAQHKGSTEIAWRFTEHNKT